MKSKAFVCHLKFGMMTQVLGLRIAVHLRVSGTAAVSVGVLAPSTDYGAGSWSLTSPQPRTGSLMVTNSRDCFVRGQYSSLLFFGASLFLLMLLSPPFLNSCFFQTLTV